MWLRLFVLVVSIPTFQCSHIVLEGSPAVVKSGLTPSMTLRCSVNDSASSSSGLVGRDITHTSTSVQQVTSIIIMKDGSDVATLTQTTPAKIVSGASNLKVTGDLIDHGLERGYLEVSWQYPRDNQTGEYVCEVNVISATGHGVVLSSKFSADVAGPTIADLVRVARTSSEERTQNQQCCELSHDSIKKLEQETQQANAKINQLDAIIKELTHKESGIVNCANTLTSTTVSQASQTVSIKFKQPYNKPPIVHIGLNMIDATTATIRANANIVHVDATGFSVKCTTWAGSVVYNLNAAWVSLAN